MEIYRGKGLKSLFYRNTGEIRNGIEFTGGNRITLNNSIRLSPQLKVLQYLLVVAGVYGTLFSLISGLDMGVYTSVLLAAIFIFSLYFFMLFLMRNLLKYSIPLSLLIYFAAGYVFWDEIKNGLWHIENIYISKFNTYYNTNVLKYLVEDNNEKAVLTIFFIFVAVLLSQLLCRLILRNTFRVLFVIITVPVVLLPFTVGYIPEPVPFGIYLACAVSIVGQGVTLSEKHVRNQKKFPRRVSSSLKNFHEKQKNILKKQKNFLKKQKIENRFLEQSFKYVIGLKIGGFLSVLLLAVILVISIIFRPDFYARKFDVADTKYKIQKEMMEFNLEDAMNDISGLSFDGLNVFRKVTASGGLSGGKLGRIGEVNFNYRTALRIKTPVMGASLYLKGYVGSEYKGNCWDGLSKADLKAYQEIAKTWENSDFTIGNQSSYLLALIKEAGGETYDDFELSYGEIEVEGINSNLGYIYAPYYSDYSPDTLMEVTDPEYVTPKKKRTSYKLAYYSSFNNLFQFKEEESYEKFLNDSLMRGYYQYDNSETDSTLLKRLEDYRTYEQAYRKFVYDIYTRVPDTGLENIKMEFGTVNYSEFKEQYGVNALNMIINMVRDVLDDNTTYSLTPGTLPKGKDFVEYFLYENKTGYCSHYASAAAIIFRTIGIPSRYVEGYIVKPTDIVKGQDMETATVKEYGNGMVSEKQVAMKSIDIPDANAHAWVEIYVDGFGWVPVDVTPGFTGSGDLGEASGGLQKKEGNSVKPEDFSSSPEQSEDTKKDESEKPLDSGEDSEASSSDDKEKESWGTGAVISGKGDNMLVYSYLKKIGWIILCSIILAAGVVLFLLMRAFLIMEKRENAQKTIDFSKKVLLRYNEIRRILDYYRIGINEDLTYREAAVQVEKNWELIKPGRFKRFTDIVLKARFGQYCISKEESEEAEEFYKELVDSIYKNTTPGKRIILKFIKVFH